MNESIPLARPEVNRQPFPGAAARTILPPERSGGPSLKSDIGNPVQVRKGRPARGFHRHAAKHGDGEAREQKGTVM